MISVRLSRAVLAVCLVVFVAKASDSIVRDSATWDETHYFGIGRYLLETGRWDVPGSILHPPLSFYLGSIPLMFAPYDPTIWEKSRPNVQDHRSLGMADIERGQELLSIDANRGDRLLNRCRYVMVGVAVLLGIGVFILTNRFYGPTAASLAIVLFAFCPNISAHARLLTPDIVLTTFYFLSVTSFLLMLERPTWFRATVAGMSMGLALLSKFTAVILPPVLLGLVIWWRFREKKLPVLHVAIVAVTSLLLFLAGYRFDLGPFFQGIRYQLECADRGHSAYLMGMYSTDGWWYYQSVAFLIKTPLPLIVLVLASVFRCFRRSRGGGLTREAFLIVPVVAFFGFFMVFHQSIGLRYILPVYPFLFVFAAGMTVSLNARRWGRGVLAVLIVWYLATCTLIHPDYLSYFNESVGGASRGYRYLVDSNLDWGQGLKRLKSFMDDRGISRIHLSYFGSDSPERYGIVYDWLPSYLLRNLSPSRQVPMKEGDWVAVSATNLQGVCFDDKGTFQWLKDREPDEVLGHSIFVYRLRK